MSVLTLAVIGIVVLLLTNVTALALVWYYRGERDAWRRSAYKAAAFRKIAQDDTDKAHAVARDLARRGFTP
jgi:hypothetical protein